MGKVINLSEARNTCDLTDKTGEELLKALLLCANESEESEEYKVFLASIKALHDSNTTAPESSLRMQVKYDRQKGTVDFTFKFEKVNQDAS